MRLEEKEYYEFLAVHPKLLHFVGIKNNFLPANIPFTIMRDMPAQEKFHIRESLYDNIGLIEEYIKENVNTLSARQVDMLQQFKIFKRGDFYLLKMSEEENLFMDDDYVYAVSAHNEPFDFFFQQWSVPIKVVTVLLPYNGKIIYDGLIANYPIQFEPTEASELNRQMQLKIKKHGIIRTLPIKK